MSRPLRSAAAVAPSTLIVALHGYGGSGDEMRRWLEDAERSLGPRSDHNVTVWAPTGTEPAPLARQGRAWFPLTSRPDSLRELARVPARRLAAELKARQQELEIAAERTCIVAFSQGCNVALALLARHRDATRAVLISGRFEATPHEPVGGVALLGIAGERDRFVDPGNMAAGLEAFGAASHELRVVPGLGHGLTRQVARMALAFGLGESPQRHAREIVRRGPSRPRARAPVGPEERDRRHAE